MRLYYSPGACSLAPHIVLEETGQKFELELVSSMNGETRTPEYLRINPKGRVPVLYSEGQIITEVSAILIYLAQRFPQAKLLGSSSMELIRVVEWMSWISSGVHALPIAQNWRSERFTDIEAHFEEIRSKGIKNLKEAYDQINDRLSQSQYSCGDHYCVVDAYLLVFFRWGNRLGLDMASQYRAWTHHAKKLLERPAVQRALETEEISIWE